MDISDVWEEEGWNESYPKGFRALSSVDDKQYFRADHLLLVGSLLSAQHL